MTVSSSGLRARPSARAAAALLGCALPLSLPLSALAQTVVASLDPVVVTASRAPQPLSRVLADLSVLQRDAIERSGATCAADLLARLPGVEISRNGGPAATTSVFLRGAESRHTAVYIDGLRVDGQATGGAPWELIPIDQIDRVEVLRGPAAALYGSDAIGGVVQFFTKRGSAAPQASVAVSGGRYGQVQGSAAASGLVAGVDYAVSASQGRADGFNARTISTANPDRDGWRRSSAQGSVGATLAPGQRVEAALIASNLWGQYDGFGTADDVSRQTLRSASLSWDAQWRAGSATRMQLGQSQNTYETQPSFYRTETTLRNYLLQHRETVATGQQLSLALERREDELLNPATAYAETLKGARHQNAVALGWQADVGEHGLQALVRSDDDSQFGRHPTASLAWGWQFLPTWRLSASAATSFRAPTLYQRFSQYGTPDLAAEKGRNTELALRWADGDSQLSLTAWHNRIRNLITYTSAGDCISRREDPTYGGCYQNVGHSRLQGVTLAGRTRLAGVALHGSVDYHDARNLDLDRLLARRARTLATAGADGQWGAWGWGVDLQAAGARFDDAANTRRLGGYGLVGVRAERELVPGLTLEGRIDNLADKRYELARTYATAGRSAQLGLRWALR